MSNFEFLDGGGVQWLNAYLGLNGEPFLYHLWFLRDLFLMNLLAPVVSLIVDKWPRITFFCLLVLWVFNVFEHLSGWNFQCIYFWILGYYCVRYDFHLSRFRYKSSIIILIEVALLFIDVLSKHSFALFHEFTHQIVILYQTLFALWIASLLESKTAKRQLPNVVKYSFGIYLFHEYFLSIIKKVTAYFYFNDFLVILILYVVLPFVVFALVFLFNLTFSKVLPKVYKVFVGGRF